MSREVVSHGPAAPSFLAGRGRLPVVATIVVAAAVAMAGVSLSAVHRKVTAPAQIVVWSVSALQPRVYAADGVVRIGVVVSAVGGGGASLHGLRFGFGNATAVPPVDLGTGARRQAVLEFTRKCWLLPGSQLLGVPTLRAVDGAVAVLGVSDGSAPTQVPLRVAGGAATLLAALTTPCIPPADALHWRADVPLRVVAMAALPDGSLAVVTAATGVPGAATFSVQPALASSRWHVFTEPPDTGTGRSGTPQVGYRVRLEYDCTRHGRVLAAIRPVLVPVIRSGRRVWSDSIPGWDPGLATTVALTAAIEACS